MQRMWRALALVTVGLLAQSSAQAKPAHKKALADHFGPFLTAKLNDCRTCHVPEEPGASGAEATLASKPHNPFGARLKAVRKELNKAGKKTEIPARLEAIANEDSDGDGVSNLIELLAGHNPGDADDKPTPAEIAEARKKLALFEKYRIASAWTPFEPVQRPPVPAVKNRAWVRNPIDAFLAAEHEARGLKPRPQAPKHILLRRIYLDLIGLPPTREEVHAFLADFSPDAYEKVINRLLADRRYGERWGRHWMDIWRYSDWAGFGMEVRDSQRHIWRWRDWIVESLNADKGYDRMVQEMLAGDELAPEDPNTLRATGFLVRNWYMFNRNTWLENTIEHTSKAFLGITMNCAKCHDHFFDPIAQQEYYQFRAFFEPHDIRTDRVPGQADLVKDGLVRVYDAKLDASTYLFTRGNEKDPDQSRSLPPATPAVLAGPAILIKPVRLPLMASCPDKRPFVIAETLKADEFEVRNARQQRVIARDGAASAVTLLSGPGWEHGRVVIRLALAQKALEAHERAVSHFQLAEARHAALAATIHAELLEDAGRKDTPEWKETASEAVRRQRMHALLEARYKLLLAKQNQKLQTKALQEVQQALAKAEADSKLPVTANYANRAVKTYPGTSTGRRLALARWITDKKNPLTARVAMNHLWLRHFGKPIVPTEFDFGKNGRPPSHPRLLDWLAAEFMERHWNMKQMHRLLVTSSAYRMDSSTDAADLAIDSDNRYWWRINVRRMEAELVRDSVLHLAGQLDPTMGGPDIDHNLGLTTNRRSLYYQHAPEKQMEFLALFDAANVTECYRRTESIVPQQALALANSSLVLAQSRLLARRLTKEMVNQPASLANFVFVKAAFEQILGRLPAAQEQSECEKFLAEQTALLADKKKLRSFAGTAGSTVPAATDAALRARENLVHVLLNHNDFVTIR